MTDTLSLTPTEEVILDALCARYRTGEHLWTFSSKVAPAARKLVEKGLVHDLGNINENTIRLSLTDKAKADRLDPRFDPPERRRIQVTVEVDTDDIKHVLAFVSNKHMPPPRGDSGMIEKWLGFAQQQRVWGETERYWEVVGRMPPGLAWAYLKSHEDGGEEELRSLLDAAEATDET